MQRTLFPLRSTLGAALRVRSASVIARSAEFDSAAIPLRVSVCNALGDVLAFDYGPFLPTRLVVGAGERYDPMQGTATYPGFPDLPFVFEPRLVAPPGGGPLPGPPTVEIGVRETIAITGIAQAPSDVVSRKVWVDIAIDLEEETVVGGLAFSGYPFLPGTLRDGELSSNYGLPREIRVSWPSAGAFVDADDAVTVQQLSAHSGVHAMAFGPIRTSRLVLHLGDFPSLIHSVKPSAYAERFGIVIPWLAVCGHAVRVEHRPEAPLGVLAATIAPASEVRDHGMPIPPGDGRRWNADGLYLAASPEQRFVGFSAASLTGPRRSYVVAQGIEPLRESYVSPVLEPGETVRLYFEQAAEHPRTLAGLRLDIRHMTLAGVLKNPSALEVEIAAVDPPAGMSPLALDVVRHARYFTALFDATAEPGSVRSLACRFTRSTNARYVLVSLTNASTRRAQVSLQSVAALQSAHVVVAPRPARSQSITAVHFRIVGPSLADDYARIGDPTFAFSVEHLVAGETQRSLFSAASLADLLRHGSARLFANHRYRDVEVDVSEEHATMEPDSFDEQTSDAWSTGWRRGEAGDGVGWDRKAYPTRPGFDPDEEYGFATLGNTEVRSHVNALGHEGIGVFFDQLRQIVNALAGNNPFFNDPNFWPDPSRGPQLLRQDPSHPGGLSWQDVMWRGMHGVGRVGLTNHLTLPPYLAAPEDIARMTNTFSQKVIEWARNPMAFPDGPPLDDLFTALTGVMVTTPMGPAITQLLNGLSLSLSGGVSYIGGVSLSGAGSPLLPALSHSVSSGTSGSITKQASHTGYSYAQSLAKGYDHTSVRVAHTAGLMHRTVTRRLNQPGTVKTRATGAEVMWQGEYADIVTGTVPVNVTLPGTAGVYRTVDEALRVRFNGPMPSGVRMDVWFDVNEEAVRDDH